MTTTPDHKGASSMNEYVEDRDYVVDDLCPWLLEHLTGKSRIWRGLLLDFRWHKEKKISCATHSELSFALRWLTENGLLSFSRRYGWRTTPEGIEFHAETLRLKKEPACQT